MVHQVGQAESTNHEAEDSSPVLPGGRNFGQKAQKGQGKNKVSQKNEESFGRILPKVAEKGPKNIF